MRVTNNRAKHYECRNFEKIAYIWTTNDRTMALDPNKTDAILGEAIKELLTDAGVETPILGSALSDQNKIDSIRDDFAHIMQTLGLDMTDDSLKDTPGRIAKMFVREIFWGLDYRNFPKCTTIENKMTYDSMIVERNIKVTSNCEHHFVPIIGAATVAYIPNDRILGLSKLNRVVEFFSRRPQVQERLTEQIHMTLTHILNTESVAVVIKAEHLCVKSRGVEDVNCDTVTSKLGGAFMQGTTRSEFMNMLW